MQKHNLSDMVRGWFIGNFDPSILKGQGFEVAIQKFQKGDYERRHVHKIATEITVIVSGSAQMNDHILHENDILMIPPGESTDFKALTDVVTCVVKMPCVKNDKHTV